MDFEQALEIANEVVSGRVGRHLSDVETAILQGSWNNCTYEQIAETSGYSISYLTRDVGPKFWKLLSQALEQPVSKTNFRVALERRASEVARAQNVAESPKAGLAWQAPAANPQPRCDWGEAVDVSFFYGRGKELKTLQQWIAHEGVEKPGSRCRLVVLLGMGGIGKTSLAVKLAQTLTAVEGMPFQYVIWRSLRNAPPLEMLLSELIAFLSDQEETDASLGRLMHWLRTRRCLVILDNVETLLQAGDRAGQYRSGFEAYGDLFRVVGETAHQSCLILTSREKPTEVAALEGIDLSVRSLQLTGSLETALALIQAKGLQGSLEQQRELCDRYGSSPLAIKIVATSIRDLFDGEIAAFLAEDTALFNSVRRMLDQQFERLSPLEQKIMYWLAVNREWTSIRELMEDVVPVVSRGKLLESLESLSWRSLLERQAGSYTQQPVVMEYVTDRLIDQVSHELVQREASLPAAEMAHWNYQATVPHASVTPLFQTFALLKTTVKDYIRETQTRLILEPVAERLRTTFSNPEALERQIQSLLQRLRQSAQMPSGYGCGNLINLCRHLNIDLCGYDFSHLKIWHAYLQGAELQQVNFQSSDLSKSVFTQIFGIIFCVAFSPDGRVLATGDANCDVHLWHVTDGHPILTCKGHSNWVWSVAFSPDGRLLASASEDHTIRLWDAATGEPLRTLRGHTHSVCAIAFSPDGSFLVSGSHDQTLKLWDVFSGQPLMTLEGHQDWVWSVAFSPQGKVVASGSADQTVKLWQVETGQLLKTLQGHTNWVRSLAFSPDGQLLASASEDHTINLWQVPAGTLLTTLRGHRDWVRSLAFSPDGQMLASGSADQTVRLWEVATGQVLKTLQGHTDWIRSVAFSPNGRTLATGSQDHTVKLWDASTGQVLRTLQGYTSQVRAIAFSPDGQVLASGSDDHLVKLWDVSKGKVVKVLRGHTNQVRSVAFNPSTLNPLAENGLLASSSVDHTVRLWDVTTGKVLRILQEHSDWVRSVAFNPKTQILASGSENQLVRLWDIKTGQILNTLTGHTNRVMSVAFSPDGCLLASGSDDGTVRLWDGVTGESLAVLAGHEHWIWAIAFSGDGRWLVSASEDQTLRLWEMPSGRLLQVFRGHTNSVISVAFHPHAALIASGSRDKTVRIWDAIAGTCLNTFPTSTEWVLSVAFSPDGTLLAHGEEKEMLKLWRVETGEWIKTLRADRPYEGMNITGVIGLSEAQKTTLNQLGAMGMDVG